MSKNYNPNSCQRWCVSVHVFWKSVIRRQWCVLDSPFEWKLLSEDGKRKSGNNEWCVFTQNAWYDVITCYWCKLGKFNILFWLNVGKRSLAKASTLWLNIVVNTRFQSILYMINIHLCVFRITKILWNKKYTRAISLSIGKTIKAFRNGFVAWFSSKTWKI